MTSLDGRQTPKTRALPQNRTALVAALDIGTSKVACLIARLKPCAPSEALRGRSHAVELIGISHIQSLGVKAGAVADLVQCEQSVRQAVAVAERMAKVRVESVLLSVSAGRLQGQLMEATADIHRGTVAQDDVNRVIGTGMRHATGPGRSALHALPVSYSIDGVKGIRDPRGARDSMFAVTPIKDHSFSTSGDYERGFVKDGVRYHHILDPHTGQPAHASRSVTIRAKDAFTADAWSKVLFIDGWEEGLKIIKDNKLDDFEVVWVDDQNKVHTTPGIDQDLKRLKDPTPGI